MVNAPNAGPRCPRCRRPLAAWRMDHCVYCGEALPVGLKEGFAEPEGLKWVERPPLPADLSKKLEVMKVVPLEGRGKSRSAATIVGLLSVPVFAAIFYLTWSLLRRLSPGSSILIGIAGFGVVAYLVWTFLKARK